MYWIQFYVPRFLLELAYLFSRSLWGRDNRNNISALSFWSFRVKGERGRESDHSKHTWLNNLRKDLVGNYGVGQKQSWVSKVSLYVCEHRASRQCLPIIIQRALQRMGLRLCFITLLIQLLNTYALSALWRILDAMSGKLNLMIKSLWILHLGRLYASGFTVHLNEYHSFPLKLS